MDQIIQRLIDGTPAKNRAIANEALVIGILMYVVTNVIWETTVAPWYTWFNQAGFYPAVEVPYPVGPALVCFLLAILYVSLAILSIGLHIDAIQKELARLQIT